MSFLSGLLDAGKSVVGFFSGGSIAASLAKTVVMGYALNRLNSQATKANGIGATPNIDNGVRLQVKANASSKIPVLYGTAYFGGNLIDAQMTGSNKTMWYALALSEKTGTTIAGGASSYVFKDVYWNEQRIQFKADGITVDYTRDKGGNIDRSLSGLVKVYCYAGNSTLGQVPESYSGSVPSAYSLFPNWTSDTHAMSNLIFAIVSVDYNRDQGVTGLGDMLFQVQNSMKAPGDVLYDYMTNATYGAKIPAGDIDTATLTALNAYSDSPVSYTNILLNGTTQSGIVLNDRYQINGLLDTAKPVLDNIGQICNSAASWLSYDSTLGKWGVIINRAGTSVASFNDDNILDGISVSGTGLQDLYNSVKVEFPRAELSDSADFVSIALEASDYNANEVPNALNISYDIINEPVQAQLLGFIELKQSRIDKIVQFRTDFGKINLKPGDIIDVTDTRIEFNAKLFRILTITETQDDNQALIIDITAMEYDATVYDEDLSRYEVSNTDGIVGIGTIGIPGTPEITEVEKDARPRILVETTAPTGIVEGMEFWLTTDVSVSNDSDRSYRLIASTVPAGGGTYGSGTTVTLDYDSLGTLNFIIKTRGFNDSTVGPFSSPSGSVFFQPVQTTNAIDANTSMFDSTGALLTGLALTSLASKLLDLFGGDTSKSIFDKIFDVFKDETGVDLLGQAAGGDLVVASQLTIKKNGSNVTTTTASIDFQGPFDVSTAGSDVTFKIQNGTKVNDALFWDGSEWRVAQSCCEPEFTEAIEPTVEPEGCRLVITATLPASNTTLTVDGCGTLGTLIPNTGSYFVKFGNNAGYGLYGPLDKGSGNIKLYLTDGTLVDTVASSACIISTDWVEIPFTKPRALNTDYYITIDEGCFVYCACPNRAIDDPTSWAFTVSPYTVKPYSRSSVTPSTTTSYIVPPAVRLTAKSFSPLTGQYASEGSCTENLDLKIVWNEKVLKGSGNIEIYDTVEDNIVTTKTVGSATLEAEGFATPVLIPKITNGKLTSVQIKNAGSGFKSLSILLSSPTTGAKAKVTATLSTAGAIASIAIDSPGWGYTSAPTVTLQAESKDVDDTNKDRVFNFGSLSSLGLVGGRRYVVRVPAGAAIAAREACPTTNALNDAFAYSFTLDTPLELVRYALCSEPHINDTARDKVNIRSNILLRFNKAVKVKETGPASAIIFEKSLILGDTIHQTIDMRKTFFANQTGKLSTFNDVSSTTTNTTTGTGGNLDDTVIPQTSLDLYINPTKPFKPGATYYIQVASGVLLDAVCDTAWVGISDKTTVTWTCDSIDNTTPPEPATNTPAKRVINYELGRPAVPGTGKINILDSSGNLVTQIDSTSPAITYSS